MQFYYKKAGCDDFLMIKNLRKILYFFRAREPVKIRSEAECFHNKPPAMRVVGQCL